MPKHNRGVKEISATMDEADAKIFKHFKGFLCCMKRPYNDLKLSDIGEEDYYGMEEDYKRIPTLMSRAELLSDIYKMDHPKRGKAVIFNNKVFSEKLQKQGYTERKGTDLDATKISRRLQLLGFEVEKYHDLTVGGIFKVLKALADEDYSDSDCFACVIMSHGETDKIFGSDDYFDPKDIFELFKGNNCKSLAGKPKLFFIQACRGRRLDKGKNLNVIDAVKFSEETPFPDENDVRIPNEADFLIAYSTVAGFYSWRNSANGSWFIQALVRVLDEFGTTWDLLRIMTRVNRVVAYNYKSNTLPNDPEMHDMKQIPCITSMLTKDLYFLPKSDIILK